MAFLLWYATHHPFAAAGIVLVALALVPVSPLWHRARSAIFFIPISLQCPAVLPRSKAAALLELLLLLFLHETAQNARRRGSRIARSALSHIANTSQIAFHQAVHGARYIRHELRIRSRPLHGERNGQCGLPTAAACVRNGSHTSDRASLNATASFADHLAIKLLARAHRSISGNGSNRRHHQVHVIRLFPLRIDAQIRAECLNVRIVAACAAANSCQRRAPPASISG